MAACRVCGSNAILMVHVALTATGPAYTYRCPQGHDTTTDFRSPSQDQGLRTQASSTDTPATSPPSLPSDPPDGGVADPLPDA